jgi:hypothetical protein
MTTIVPPAHQGPDGTAIILIVLVANIGAIWLMCRALRPFTEILKAATAVIGSVILIAGVGIALMIMLFLSAHPH